jgi:hypothetical protein
LKNVLGKEWPYQYLSFVENNKFFEKNQGRISAATAAAD